MQLKFLSLKNRTSVHLIFILSLVSTLTQAQYSILWPRPVEELFTADTLHWKRIYTGTLDNHHPFLMEVGFDGTLLKGWYTFGGEKEIYNLDGFMENDQFFLEEWHSDSLETGSISGRMDSLGFSGFWENYRKNTKWRVEAFEVKEAPKRPELYHQWIGAISSGGKLDGNWSLLLEEDQLIKGYYIDQKGCMHDITSYRPGERKNLFLKIHQADSVLSSSVQLNLETSRGLLYSGKDIDSIHFKFTKASDIQLVNSHSFHHFEWGYSLASFNKRIMADFEVNRDSIFKQVEINIPQESSHQYRGQVNYNGFLSPFYADNEVLSGVYQIKSYSAQKLHNQAAFPVLIDLKSKRWINLEEGIYSPAAWNLDLGSFLKEQIKLKLNDQEPVWKHVKAEDFTLLVFAGDHLLVTTKHNPMHGHLFITIPQEIIERHFSPSSWVMRKLSAYRKK